MVQRTRAADVPGFGRQDQSLEIIAMWPPTVPQLAHIFARRFFVDVEVGRFEKACCAKQQRLAILNLFAQQPQRQTLCEKCERQFVFLVTERGCDLLQKRFVVSVHVDLVATVNWFATVDPNCSIAKIRAGFTIPNTKLNDVDFVAIRADEFFPEISRKPTRLQLQLGWNPRRDE